MTPDIKKQIERASLPITGTIRQAMQAIDRAAFGAVLLIEPTTKQFMGLVTDGDIRRALCSGHGLESVIVSVPRPETRTAHIGMSTEQITSLFSESVRVIPILNDNNQVVDIALLDRRIHLPVAEPSLGDKELQYVSECILTGWISSAGQYVTRFEEAMAKFCGAKYSIATSSGTTALHLALLALGVGPGDEVIVPTLTFIATANAVTYTGAKPIFVDSEPETWTIDSNKIEEAITSRTKAIIPVHLYGHPANMDFILEIAAKYKLAVIEDAAEAHGARYKNRFVGTIGDIGIFSFYGNKIITTGEGGMAVTNNPESAEKMRILRDHGMSKKQRYWHTSLGYNYRLTNIQAAIGVAQMEKIDHILKTKDLIAQMYSNGLRDVPGICLPPKASWASSVCWLYTILIDEQKFGAARNNVIHKLQDNNIETRPVFTPAHIQPIYNTGQSLPVAEYLSGAGISLPSAVGLREKDINHVIDIIAAAGNYRL